MDFVVRPLSKSAYNELFNTLRPDERWTQVLSINGSYTEVLALRNPVSNGVIYFVCQDEEK